MSALVVELHNSVKTFWKLSYEEANRIPITSFRNSLECSNATEANSSFVFWPDPPLTCASREGAFRPVLRLLDELSGCFEDFCCGAHDAVSTFSFEGVRAWEDG